MRSGKIFGSLSAKALAAVVLVGPTTLSLQAQQSTLETDRPLRIASTRSYHGSDVSILVAPTLTAIDFQDPATASNQPASELTPATEEVIQEATSDSNAENAVAPAIPIGVQPTDALTPMQNRQLTLKVQAVSLSNEKIGTGISPQPVKATWASGEYAESIEPRFDTYTHVHWHASLIQHYPLYFEDVMLERHGFKRSFYGHELAQSFISGAKFFGTIPLLPYKRTLQSKHECIYVLGNYRPGSAAPCLQEHLPYDYRATIVESATVAGFFWAMPL